MLNTPNLVFPGSSTCEVPSYDAPSPNALRLAFLQACRTLALTWQYSCPAQFFMKPNSSSFSFLPFPTASFLEFRTSATKLPSTAVSVVVHLPPVSGSNLSVTKTAPVAGVNRSPSSSVALDSLPKYTSSSLSALVTTFLSLAPLTLVTTNFSPLPAPSHPPYSNVPELLPGSPLTLPSMRAPFFAASSLHVTVIVPALSTWLVFALISTSLVFSRRAPPTL